jgi:hypothetical protein
MAKVMKSTDSSSLAEVANRILDKGIVIDPWAKVSLVGIELLSVEARVVVASVETYLKYAEAIGLTATAARRLEQLREQTQARMEQASHDRQAKVAALRKTWDEARTCLAADLRSAGRAWRERDLG